MIIYRPTPWDKTLEHFEYLCRRRDEIIDQYLPQAKYHEKQILARFLAGFGPHDKLPISIVNIQREIWQIKSELGDPCGTS